jgi:hypothetical protein
LILWPKDKAQPKSTLKEKHRFDYQLEGYNPHWKILEAELLKNQNSSGFMSYEDYNEIDRQLRAAIQTAREMQSHQSVYKGSKLGKIHLPPRTKFGSAKMIHKLEKTKLHVHAISGASATVKSSKVMVMSKLRNCDITPIHK